jgi:hypothetical protein
LPLHGMPPLAPTMPDRLPAWAGDGVLHAVIEARQGSRSTWSRCC